MLALIRARRYRLKIEMTSRLRIGARASPLSMAQARTVRARLAASLGVSEDALDLLPMTTTGDRLSSGTLMEAGGKGLFTKELDEALLDGRIDLAVHSMKDLPTALPPGIALACAPEREDVRDAFIAPGAGRLADLPQGAVIGTASLRRQAQALHQRPDLKVMPLRGNVQTRLAKLEAGAAAATFLALAGLKRLGLEGAVASLIDPEEMPPAVAQGALAITARSDDAPTLDALAALEAPQVRLAVEAERAFLEALEGSCRTPIAALTRLTPDGLELLGEALTPDGAKRWRREGRVTDPTLASARALGLDLGGAIREEAGDALRLDR